MIAEVSQADDDRAALSFASGCVLTALRERARDVETLTCAGLWSVALLTALYAIDGLRCAARGLAVLMGAHDGMVAQLVRLGAPPSVIAAYEAARPIVVGCLAALACAQFATAWFLSRGQMRRFLIAWSAAFLVAGLAVVIQLSVIWTLDGVPSEFHALLAQAIAVPGLFAWSESHRRKSHRGSI